MSPAAPVLWRVCVAVLVAALAAGLHLAPVARFTVVVVAVGVYCLGEAALEERAERRRALSRDLERPRLGEHRDPR